MLELKNIHKQKGEPDLETGNLPVPNPDKLRGRLKF